MIPSSIVRALPFAPAFAAHVLAAQPAPPAPSDTAVAAAVATLRRYYAALDARQYRRARALWGADGPPGHPTAAAFAAGFATTDSTRLRIGTPGRLEGAAGSWYVEVPVTVCAFTRDASPVRYRGTYVLRRSTAPGAAPASRRWHLYRGTLRPVAGGRAPAAAGDRRPPGA